MSSYQQIIGLNNPSNTFFVKDPSLLGTSINPESAPFSAGHIRLSARIYENRPIRARTRQIHEFFFNDTTVRNIRPAAVNDFEKILMADRNDSSRGLGLSKMNRMRHTFLARYKQEDNGSIDTEIDFVSVADDTENFGSFDSVYINSVPVAPIDGIPPYNKMDFDPGGYSRFTKLESEQYHSCFIQHGSIFNLKNPRDIANEKLQEGDLSLIDAQVVEMWLSIDPKVTMQPFSPVTQDKAQTKAVSEEDITDAKTSYDICYLNVNCSYPGNFYTKTASTLGGFSVLSEFEHPQRSYIIGKHIVETQPSYSGLPPGKHVSLKKLTPIFPGEDFAITIRKASHDESVCTTQPKDGTSVAYRLVDQLKYIDPFFNDGFDPYNMTQIPPNYGVARFVPGKREASSDDPTSLAGGEGEATLKLSNKSSDFSSEPYVIIEIDGGINNYYILIITYGETVKLFEVQDDPELISVYATSSRGGGQIIEKRVVPSSPDGHSSLIYEFDFNGEKLLKEDRFKIFFQHVNGALQVTFDVVDKIYVVSRDRLSDKFKTAVQNDEFDNDTLELKDFDKIEYQFAPIKLRGYPWINMGHYSASINFSPITYLDTATIEPSIPIPVLGFFDERYTEQENFGQNTCYGDGLVSGPTLFDGCTGDNPVTDYGPGGITGFGNVDFEASSAQKSVGEDVTSMLLRTRGAPYDVEEEGEESSAASASASTSNPSGDNDNHIEGMESLYYKQQATQFAEIVNGESFEYNSWELPYSQRQMIPGLFDRHPGSINEFSHGGLIKHSLLTCVKTPNAPSEGQESQYAFQYNASVVLSAGSVGLSNPYPGARDPEADTSYWSLDDCIRPISYGFTNFVSEGTTPMYFHEVKEVGQHAVSFSDSWSRNDRTFIDHSGNIKFYLSRGPASGVLEGLNVSPSPGSNSLAGSLADDSPTANLNMLDQPSVEIGTPSLIETGQAPDETAFLASLQDKTFYIRIYAWRESSMFTGTTDNSPPNEETKNHLIFTGICDQSSFTVYDSHIEMTCELSDYNKILEHTLWFNSPYYDAMRDVNVIYDIVVQAGLFSGEYDGSFDPASLVKKYADLPTSSEYSIVEHNGDCFIYNDYVLPGHYDPLQNQLFRFEQGSSFFDSVKRLAAVSGKTAYFDRFGVLHFDVPEDEEELYNIDKADSERVFDRPPIRTAFWWSTDPSRTNASESSTGGASTQSLAEDRASSGCSDNSAFAVWNTVIGEYNFKRLQGDTFNEVRVVSSSPDMKLLIASSVNVKSLYDPTAQGFRGYKRVFLQQSGYFGSLDAVFKTVSRYTSFFTPPSFASFKVLGRSGLRPMNTITLDGIGMSSPMRLVLVNVSNTINAAKNEWTTDLEGRYLYPGQIISFKGNQIKLP